MAWKVERYNAPACIEDGGFEHVTEDFRGRGIAMQEEQGWRGVFKGGVGDADEAMRGIDSKARHC